MVCVVCSASPSSCAPLLAVVRARSPQAAEGKSARLALLLGQAGNREDGDLRDLAATAAAFHPDLVVLKELLSHLRGRQPGDVVAILKQELLDRGVAQASIETRREEIDAARSVLEWARDGDVLVLPIHDKAERTKVVDLLDRLAAQAWTAGEPLAAP